MSKSIWILLAVLPAAPPLGAEIFKCDGTSGTDRYQNFPCHLESIGSLPASQSGAAGSAAKSGAQPGLRVAAQAAAASEPKPGMTQDEVRAIWGDPMEMTEDSPRRGRIETWQYSNNRSVRFDPKRRVVAVQR